MFTEYLLHYERSNIEDEVLIQMAKEINVTITEEFIEDKLFFGGEFSPSDYGTGKVYILKNEETEKFIVIDTFLVPDDQFEMMYIGVRCETRKKEKIKDLLLGCFEEVSTKPLGQYFKIIDNDLLLQISKMDKIDRSIYYSDKKFGIYEVEVELIPTI
ncbi:hypothetical protein [Bacillus pseudomycoides]|uniref:hypothetical protein n=1 Tax=Bacillus pseudomycoides TaxID=64104 RepID=UPI000BED7EEF|nr:hypothetical protein [Bacillus pseudomycoides]PEA81208.1 hypothetical protein CON99_24185 [Bacillus pseudomycoides]PHB15855.1 hypothetical protein COE85_23310 [Bacillus pseudomycoides]